MKIYIYNIMEDWGMIPHHRSLNLFIFFIYKKKKKNINRLSGIKYKHIYHSFHLSNSVKKTNSPTWIGSFVSSITTPNKKIKKYHRVFYWFYSVYDTLLYEFCEMKVNIRVDETLKMMENGKNHIFSYIS